MELANRRLKPLGHPSIDIFTVGKVTSIWMAENPPVYNLYNFVYNLGWSKLTADNFGRVTIPSICLISSVSTLRSRCP